MCYDTAGFVEKNRDVLHGDLLDLMRGSEAAMVSAFAVATATAAAKGMRQSAAGKRGSVSQTLSVGGRFKGQLVELMHKLNSATPHYIRCGRYIWFTIILCIKCSTYFNLRMRFAVV